MTAPPETFRQDVFPEATARCEQEDGPQWVVFSSEGMASLILGDTITKAVANWRKATKGRGEPVGVIRCGYSGSLPHAMRGTDVSGVICCIHKPGEQKP
jgi:hypothetical protein